MSTQRRFTRRLVLQTAGWATVSTWAAGAHGADLLPGEFDVAEKSISQLQAAMTGGRVTSVQLVRAYLDRIAAYDQQGPCLNAVLHLDPNALQQAKALDDERAAKGPRGPLHGIPVLLKDNFDTRDMPTTGGSLGLLGAQPAQDAFQVARLRAAGCVLLGKVNLHELALGLTTHSSLGGQTLNPYDVARAPGGSSGGSGVAAAASFAAFTMGTDTAGSIRIPSSHNSIVGLRPSEGLSSRAGIIPFGHMQDVGGPMARTVEDIALVLDATVGFDPADPVTAAGRDRIPRSYTAALQRDALKGARIGVLSAFFGTDPQDQEVAQVIQGALGEMRKLGASTVDVAIPELSQLLDASALLWQELKFYLRDYLEATPGASAKSIETLMRAGLLSNTLQFALTRLFDVQSQTEDYLRSDDYKARLAARARLADAVTKVMDDQRLDAIAFPITRRIAPLHGGPQMGSNATLSAQSGLPEISVPAGFTAGGFPVGIELLGRRFAETRLLALAYAFEQAGPRRRPPPRQMLESHPPATVPVEGPADTGPGSQVADFKATASQPGQTPAPLEANIRLRFNAATRQLGYEIACQGVAPEQVGGISLHQRQTGDNGPVVHVLGKPGRAIVSGRVTLLEPLAADLKAGKCYISVVGKSNPLFGARADIRFPAA